MATFFLQKNNPLKYPRLSNYNAMQTLWPEYNTSLSDRSQTQSRTGSLHRPALLWPGGGNIFQIFFKYFIFLCFTTVLLWSFRSHTLSVWQGNVCNQISCMQWNWIFHIYLPSRKPTNLFAKPEQSELKLKAFSSSKCGSKWWWRVGAG